MKDEKMKNCGGSNSYYNDRRAGVCGECSRYAECTAGICVTRYCGKCRGRKGCCKPKKEEFQKQLKYKKNVTLKKKKSCKINVELQPVTASDKVKFVSSNKKVATVNAKGVIKAKKAGTAKITVRTGKKRAVVKVKVK